MASLGRELVVQNAPAWTSTEPQWGLVLADLATGEDIADLSGAAETVYTFQLNRPTTITFRLNIQHPAVVDVLTRQHCYVKAYKRRRLMAICETGALELAGGSDGRQVAVVCQDAAYTILSQRLIGQSAAGVYYESMDRGDIARQIIDELNTADDTAVRVSGVQASSPASAGPWYYKSAIEAIQELGEPLNGFDHWFIPADPHRDANDAIGYLQVAPLRGGFKPEAIFEFGSGRANVADYAWRIDNSQRITRALSLPPSYPDNAGLVVQSADNSALEAIIRRREAVVQSDLVDEDLRQELVDEHVAIRANPRNIFTFNPDIDDLSGRVPAFGVDFGIGDLITGRVYDSGVVMLDGVVRVYGAEVSTDLNGTESVKLTLVEES